MEFHILDLKSEMIKNGIKMLDLNECNFEISFSTIEELKLKKILILDETFEGRPDLLQYKAGYNTVNELDIILKFNEISNPFSIKSGDLIVIPDVDIAKRFYKKDNTTNHNSPLDLKKLYIDTSKKPQDDKARLKQLQKISKRKNSAKETLPPNLLRSGQSAFTIDEVNGTITLSPFNS